MTTISDNNNNNNNNKIGNTLLKVVAILVIAFIVFILTATIIAYYNGAFAYEFVYCLHEPTNTNVTYPEGTKCDNNDDDLDDKTEGEMYEIYEEKSKQATKEEEEKAMEMDDFDLASKVIKVVDGDTIDLQSGERIRLSIANTPERGQEGWKEATQFTKKLCLNKDALVDIDDKQDKSYDRIVGLVYCDGEILNKELIESGHALIWKKFCNKSEFEELLCVSKVKVSK